MPPHQSNWQRCAGKDVTGSKTQAKLVQLIGQIEGKRQGLKRSESEAPGRLNFRFVAACGSGKIVKIVGSNPGAVQIRDLLAFHHTRQQDNPVVTPRIRVLKRIAHQTG